MVELDNVVSTVTVLGFGAGAFKYAVINPLQKSIDGLQESINKIYSQAEKHTASMHKFDLRLNDVENKCAMNEKQIERIEDFVDRHCDHSIKKKVE